MFHPCMHVDKSMRPKMDIHLRQNWNIYKIIIEYVKCKSEIAYLQSFFAKLLLYSSTKTFFWAGSLIQYWLGTTKCDKVLHIGHDLTISLSYSWFERQFRMHFKQKMWLQFSKIANRLSESGSNEITSSIQMPQFLPFDISNLSLWILSVSEILNASSISASNAALHS